MHTSHLFTMPAFGTAFLLCPLSSTCSPFSLCECCIQKHKDTSGAVQWGNASFLEHAFHRAQSNNRHGKFLNWTKQSGAQGNICGSRNVHRDMLGGEESTRPYRDWKLYHHVLHDHALLVNQDFKLQCGHSNHHPRIQTENAQNSFVPKL